MGLWFSYKFEHTFTKGQAWSFDDSAKFPCLKDDVLYIQMTEKDANVNESDAIRVDCSSLPIGELDFELVINEDSGSI